MPNTTTALTAAGETYLADLGRVRASGGATRERSSYGPLANLLNAVGATLAPKVFCVGELADQGAGHPDFGLYAAKQVQQGRPREAQVPERGVVEVKAAGDDAWLTAAGDQVSRYWGRYRLVLVTNTRDFVLVGEDAAGRPTKLETFRLAADADTFVRRLETPRAFAREVGAGLGEYLTRALSHRAALAEPKDLAWLLASYARDGLARVETAGESPPLAAVRAALEDALGVRFEGERGARFFHSTVAALGTPAAAGEDDIRYFATAFVFGHPGFTSTKPVSYWVFVVTNRHVVEGQGQMWIRFHAPAGKRPKVLPIPRGPRPFPWVLHQDPDIDLAVLPVNAIQIPDGLAPDQFLTRV